MREATGAVGSTDNFAASLCQRMIRAFAENDFARAMTEQLKSIALIARLASALLPPPPY